MSMGKYQVFLRVAACGGFTRAAEVFAAIAAVEKTGAA